MKKIGSALPLATFDRPLVTVDVVIFALRDDTLTALLVVPRSMPTARAM